MAPAGLRGKRFKGDQTKTKHLNESCAHECVCVWEKERERAMNVSQCNTSRLSHLIGFIAKQRVTASLFGLFKLHSEEGWSWKRYALFTDRDGHLNIQGEVGNDIHNTEGYNVIFHKGLSSGENEARLGGCVLGLGLSLVSPHCHVS